MSEIIAPTKQEPDIIAGHCRHCGRDYTAPLEDEDIKVGACPSDDCPGNSRDFLKDKAMHEVNHTTQPWEYALHENKWHVFKNIDVETDTGWGLSSETIAICDTEAVAAFIAHASNNYHDLLGVLKGLLADIEYGNGPINFREVARALISKVEDTA